MPFLLVLQEYVYCVSQGCISEQMMAAFMSEQMATMVYRNGSLTEIDPKEDLFFRQLIEADRKDSESTLMSDPYYVGDHLRRIGYSEKDSFGFDHDCKHVVWKNENKYLVILGEPELGPFAFVRLESHIEFMNFVRDYLLPLIKLQSHSESYMPPCDEPGCINVPCYEWNDKNGNRRNTCNTHYEQYHQ